MKPIYSFNEHYFHTWSSDMAYILGFIMADGCVYNKDLHKKYQGYKLAINIHRKDKIILEYMCKQMNVDIARIKDREWIGSDNIFRKQSSFIISSKIMIRKLAELGVIPRKTGKEQIPISMPNEYWLDFFSGYFDGDGCILITTQYYKKGNKYYPKYNFKLSCSNKDFLIYCKQRFNNLGGTVRLYTSNCYSWDVQGKKDIQYIGSVMYDTNRSFSLPRKKDKILSI